MKLYVVTADTWTEGYGSSINLLLVTDNRDFANQRFEYAVDQGWEPTITEVEFGTDVEKYLGGYIE